MSGLWAWLTRQQADARYQALSGLAYARKTADNAAVNNSTVLVNDTHLKFAVAANETWTFEIFVQHQGPVAGDFKCTVTGPAGSAGAWGALGPDTTLTASATPTAPGMWRRRGLGSDMTYGTEDTSGSWLLIKGIIRNGSTAGDLQFQFAQSVATVGNTLTAIDSYIAGRKVA